MSKRKSSDKLDREWENRVLCADESCIGVIGPDGRCKECGLANDGDWPAFSQAQEQTPEYAVDEDPPPDEERPVDTAENETRDAPVVTEDDEWNRRTLCSDESCIGVIGPDNRCKECGKPFKP